MGRLTEISEGAESSLCNLSSTVLSTPSPKTARQVRVPKARPRFITFQVFERTFDILFRRLRTI
jgi:hypothetical protein